MKKSLIFLATAFLLNASVAKSLPTQPLLDDFSSFRIAKSVKLGYGENSRHLNKGIKTSDFKTCSSDDNCPATQECVNGNCKDLCSPNPCPEQKPDCEAKDHAYACTCTKTSCGEGKECVSGKCESCTVGSKCSCDGEKVLGTSGTCVCPSGLSCSAGQYVGGDCSCTSCPENDTRENKCGCPGNTVPDGNGSCYCKTTKSCDEGYSFDSSNTCECVACTDNDSCDNPCSAGTIPTPDGCKAYACAVDEDCAEGNRCENGGTESAQCVPCGKNEQCRCPEGQLSDGNGGCKSADPCANVTCDGGKVCSAGSCVCPSNKPYSAGGQCRECTSDSHCGNTQSCSNYQCVDLSCSSCETASNHQCVPKACPDGWNSPENIPFCLNGQTKKTDSCGCWKCEGEACPAGYMRGTPLNCLASQKVATIGKKVNGQYCSKCVDKDCYDYGYIPQTKGCPEGEKMMAVPIPEASYLSCGKCSEINYFPIGGGDGPTKCSSSQLDCGSIGCCPKHPNGCAEYANDCKYAGNGMYTACRCMVYDTTSKFIN